MKKQHFFLLIVVTILMISTAYAETFSNDPSAINLAAQSVMMLEVYDDNGNLLATGSGFVAFDNRHLLTNYHVVQEANHLIAISDKGDEYYVSHIDIADERRDIAVLEFFSPTDLIPLSLNGSREVIRAEKVVTIGSPEGLNNTVSTGIISSVFESNGVKMIQITAPISSGSSGGALFDDSGIVIGITSAFYRDGQNLNFAVNIPEAIDLFEQWDGIKYALADSNKAMLPPPVFQISINSAYRSGSYYGELENDLPNGYGVFVSDDDMPFLSYKGNWKNGEAIGKGIMENHEYTIQFNDPFEGFYIRTGSYNGEVVDGIPNGKGQFETRNTQGVAWTYTGEFADGTFNGLGELAFENDPMPPYSGNFINGIYTPSWRQMVEYTIGCLGLQISSECSAFMESHESVFTSYMNIDTSLIDSNQDYLLRSFYSLFRMDKKEMINKYLKCKKLIHLENATIIDAYPIIELDINYDGYILEVCDDSNISFLGILDGDMSCDIKNTKIDLYLLPIGLMEEDLESGIQTIVCIFAKQIDC